MTTDDELREHFEHNMLDGDKIQEGQMLSSESVFEYLEKVVRQRERAAQLELLDRLDHEPQMHGDWQQVIEDIRAELEGEG